MVCFETKEEANTAIQDLNETTRYTVKKYEPKTKRKNVDNQDKIYTNKPEESEQEGNQLNTVTTEHIAQTTQSTNRSEQNNNKNWQWKNNRLQRTRKSDHRSVMLWMWIKRT